MIFINLRPVFIILSTSSLDLCSFHDILNIHLYVHISKASIHLVKVFVMVHFLLHREVLTKYNI